MSDHNESSEGAFWGGAICGFLIGGIAAFILSELATLYEVRQQAVEHGVAEWVVDGKGNVNFQWKGEKGE
jgi:D-alanyl-lipoteichoic acid acyltransferase DltB (MBOAT superfamily)